MTMEIIVEIEIEADKSRGDKISPCGLTVEQRSFKSWVLVRFQTGGQ